MPVDELLSYPLDSYYTEWLGIEEGRRKEWESDEAEERVRCWFGNINNEIQRKKNKWSIEDPGTGYKKETNLWRTEG